MGKQFLDESGLALFSSRLKSKMRQEFTDADNVVRDDTSKDMSQQKKELEGNVQQTKKELKSDLSGLKEYVDNNAPQSLTNEEIDDLIS